MDTYCQPNYHFYFVSTHRTSVLFSTTMCRAWWIEWQLGQARHDCVSIDIYFLASLPIQGTQWHSYDQKKVNGKFLVVRKSFLTEGKSYSLTSSSVLRSVKMKCWGCGINRVTKRQAHDGNTKSREEVVCCFTSLLIALCRLLQGEMINISVTKTCIN